MNEKSEALPIDQHPGVQGLAQLGRNAIDRVIELEQARARDNVAFKQLLAQRDALLEALQWIDKRCPRSIMKHPPHLIHQEMAHDAGVRARAAIKMVEEGK